MCRRASTRLVSDAIDTERSIVSPTETSRPPPDGHLTVSTLSLTSTIEDIYIHTDLVARLAPVTQLTVAAISKPKKLSTLNNASLFLINSQPTVVNKIHTLNLANGSNNCLPSMPGPQGCLVFAHLHRHSPYDMRSK